MVLFGLLGCFSSPSPGGHDSAPAAEGRPNWTEDVAPLLTERCLECHQAGGAGGFALDTYEVARGYADRIAAVTAERSMPPWLPDNSGECQQFDGARWLEQAEIDTFAAWAEAGAPEGAGATPEPPPAAAGLAEDDLTLDIGGEYEPKYAEIDDYRCFVLELPFEGPRWLAGYQTVPTNLPLAHHITLYQAADTNNADAARNLDAADEEPGWDCQHGLGVPGFQVIALWNIGTPAINFPEGTGIPVDGGLPLLVRSHYYVPAPNLGTDRTAFHFDVEEQVEHEARYVPFSNEEISLPPGDAAVTSYGDFSAADAGIDAPVTLWGVAPHMHQLGVSMEVTKNPSNDPTCLLRAPRWDYHWQSTFFYEAAPTLLPEDTVRVSCTWDTTTQEDTVEFAAEAAGEMCLAAFYVTD